ncbi:MAG: OsmC family protein [Thermoflexales bacterium]
MEQEKHHVFVRWQGGRTLTFDGFTHSGYRLVLDAAPPLGQGEGARPMELLITGLAGCTAMDVLSILWKKREPVQGFEVHVEGVRATEHPRVYVEIEVLYRVFGEVSVDSVERAIQLSVERYCGANAMLREVAHITHRYEILAASQAVT